MAKRKNKKFNSGTLFITVILFVGIFLAGIFIGTGIVNQDNENGSSQNVGTNYDDGLDEDEEDEKDEKDESSEEERYYMNDVVSMTGYLNQSEAVGNYTHYIEDNEKFGFRSSEYFLNDFVGKEIELTGTVIDVRSDFYVVEVNDIEYKDEEDDEIEDNLARYFFPEYGMYFDFGYNTGYTIMEEEDVLFVKEINDEEENILATISPFECVPGSDSQDCDDLEDRFTGLGFDSFTSSEGISFINIAETPQWIFFNRGLWGYYISPSSESDLIDISDYMYLFEKQDVEDELTSNIDTVCFDDNYTMDDYYQIEVYLDDGQMKATIVGESEEGDDISCELDINLGDDIYTDLIKITTNGDVDDLDLNGSQDQETDDVHDQPMTQPDNEEENGEESEETEDFKEETSFSLGEGTQTFSSARGFDITLSEMMMYSGRIVSEDFSIDGLDCNYKIGITHWQNEDQLETDPGIGVYYCETSLSEDDIKTNIGSNYIVENAEENIIIIEYKDHYKEAAEDIIID
ncbi:hypothetical protein [Candidatus Absconditicoccus praedator]|uniref:hypothetical protein n=1 Tax=Candidatus Absconditicoccus praedator TaxID=2735562 RepID=UPI001E39CEC4|nr:hypothetical protein [Candidatus Absconditicoccus praedator]UFX83506.1 hypothetical protein HLG78_05245 [Candidatus Absconditicoccus praedator]